MSLNFDLTEIEKRLGKERYDIVTTDPATLDKPENEQKLHPVTNGLIWASMAVALGTITEANVDEWCFRLGLTNKVSNDALALKGGIGTFNYTKLDIEDHIGLRTNVSTKRRDQWLSRTFRKGSISEKDVTLPGTESAGDRINAAVKAYHAKQSQAE